MGAIRSFRGKGLGAVALLVVVALCAVEGPGGAIGFSRWLLGGAAVAGFGLWLRREGSGASVPAVPPLRVAGRAGLGPRCGVALVQAEGRSFLVTHGDGFANVHPLPVEARWTPPDAPARASWTGATKEVLP